MSRKDRRELRARESRPIAGPGQPARPVTDMLFAQASAALQSGRLQEAETLFGQVLRADPDHAEAHNWLGAVHSRQGQTRQALEHCAKAAALSPGSADFANNLGLAQLKAGDLDAAGRSFEKALKLNPQLAQAHHNLGLVFKKKRELDQAIACFRRAIALVPNYANAHLNLGNALRDGGKIEEAIAQFRKLAGIVPNSREAHFNLAGCLMAAKRFEEAEAAYRRVLALDPNFADAHTKLGDVLTTLGRFEEAEAAYRRVLALDPKFTDAYTKLGSVLATLGRFEEASAHYAYTKLGSVLATLGRFEEASAHYESALALDAGNADALYGLVSSSKAYSTPAMAARIEGLLTASEPPGNSLLHFALGKIYDDMGEYAKAFEHYRSGNETAVPEAWFDPEIWARYVDRMIATFTPEFFAERKSIGNPSRRPIFIFGMPRSGTTLTEQIIASHPEVAPGGELGAMGELSGNLPKRLQTDLAYPECAVKIDERLAQELAAEYLAAIGKLGGNAARVTDKMSMNYRDLGFIALLFPNATFIHCRRDPLDTCLSCYFQQFDRFLDFSYSLENLGSYYRGYRRLMDHWRKTVPVKMLELDYEDLVADQEGMSWRLIAHCGLEWDDRCLAFHKTDRPVRTSSLWQVRQPLYSRSVERWKRYEAFIGPLRTALEQPES